MLRFYKQQSYFNPIVSKKAKITVLLFMKNSKSNSIILGVNFKFFVFGLVYPTNRTNISFDFFAEYRFSRKLHDFNNINLCLHSALPAINPNPPPTSKPVPKPGPLSLLSRRSYPGFCSRFISQVGHSSYVIQMNSLAGNSKLIYEVCDS